MFQDFTASTRSCTWCQRQDQKVAAALPPPLGPLPPQQAALPAAAILPPLGPLPPQQADLPAAAAVVLVLHPLPDLAPAVVSPPPPPHPGPPPVPALLLPQLGAASIEPHPGAPRPLVARDSAAVGPAAQLLLVDLAHLCRWTTCRQPAAIALLTRPVLSEEVPLQVEQPVCRLVLASGPLTPTDRPPPGQSSPHEDPPVAAGQCSAASAPMAAPVEVPAGRLALAALQPGR